MRFNRNIIIQADVDRLMDPRTMDPKTLTAAPPSGYAPALALPQLLQGSATPARDEAAAIFGIAPATGVVAVPSEDDYLTKVLKYVPVEALAAYLFMAGVIGSNVTGKHDRAMWLGGLLIGTLVLTIPYDLRVLSIVRWQQVTVSVVGIAVYVFALGGWFATTTWYHQWYASIVVPVFGLLIAVLRLPPLPANLNSLQLTDQTTGHASEPGHAPTAASSTATAHYPVETAVPGCGVGR
jgi:hypothetical protein